ncbi:HAD-like protein [Gloeophyllum trabeum ATCC 11539]|uniref:HAD-like protein n=1 Tax=Gloeophyllum trabeum (strain ATCC 11539 / FP-39264 / Madison 617) TaxID=670483 RepID=S7PTX9_GLOTA|nr:HAD-like protein [Gloeophyllum trabeum ATCC 11539]EPQ50898.1 HAD-like protein [Gloeophyllum trabeum ATCC 11539]
MATIVQKLPKVEYAIFDLDGLMIDSERIYTEVTSAYQILAEYGVQMTWDIKAGLMGKPEREAAAHLLSFFPGLSLTIEEYLKRRDVLQNALWPTVPPLPGIIRLVQHLHKHSIPIAISTGTRRANFNMKTSHLEKEIFGYFGNKVVCGDDDILKVEGGGKINGKPAPDGFLVAAREMLGRNVGKGAGESATPEQRAERAKGLVFEDAIPGVQSGKRAGMNVVWVPDPNLASLPYPDDIERPDQTLPSLEAFVPEQWGLPPYDNDALA